MCYVSIHVCLLYYLGLTNFDEYDLVRERNDEEKENGTLGSRRSGSESGTLKKGTLSRESKDQKKIEKLKQNLATDDGGKN